MMARLMPSDDIAYHPLGYYRGVLGSSIEPEAPALPGACFYSLCIGGAPNRPHTGGAGDLREYDSFATSQSGDRHGSGAYAVFIDQQAPGSGPPGSLRRVVPLPPPELSGGVKFTTVVLSLAYDNFGEAGAPATIPATVRVLRGSGPAQTLNVTIEVGRKFFHFFHADDQAASVQLNPPAGFRPHVTALVEHAFP